MVRLAALAGLTALAGLSADGGHHPGPQVRGALLLEYGFDLPRGRLLANTAPDSP